MPRRTAAVEAAKNISSNANEDLNGEEDVNSDENNGDNNMDKDALVTKLCTITGASKEVGLSLLSDCGWSLETAVQLFMEDDTANETQIIKPKRGTKAKEDSEDSDYSGNNAEANGKSKKHSTEKHKCETKPSTKKGESKNSSESDSSSTSDEIKLRPTKRKTSKKEESESGSEEYEPNPKKKRKALNKEESESNLESESSSDEIEIKPKKRKPMKKEVSESGSDEYEIEFKRKTSRKEVSGSESESDSEGEGSDISEIELGDTDSSDDEKEGPLKLISRGTKSRPHNSKNEKQYSDDETTPKKTKKRKSKSFSGKGNVLGYASKDSSPVVTPPEVNATVINTDPTQTAQDSLTINQDEAITNVQIRTHDGQSIKLKVNYTHTVGDLMQCLRCARLDLAKKAFTLGSRFPTKELVDEKQTIRDAGIGGAAIFLKLK